MTEWKEGIWLGISALLTAMLITFAVVLGGVVKEVSHMQQNELNTTAQMQEYRKWAPFDNTIVNSADVISCIIANKSSIPSIIVKKDISVSASTDIFSFNVNTIKNYTWNIDNSAYLWDGTKKDDYTFDRLNAYIPPQATYKAHIEKDLNGVVIYIWFKRIPMWSTYEDVIISGDDLIACITESRYISVEFEFIDNVINYQSRWNEYSLTNDKLNELKSNIASKRSYRANIYRNSDGTINHIGFRRTDG
jgi:hypothetical protein